jgi:hypothetical protein
MQSEILETERERSLTSWAECNSSETHAAWRKRQRVARGPELGANALRKSTLGSKEGKNVGMHSDRAAAIICTYSLKKTRRIHMDPTYTCTEFPAKSNTARPIL